MCPVSEERPSYQQTIAAFDWAMALDDLGWTGRKSVDLAWTMVDRHARGARAGQTAIHWVGANGAERRISFRELSQQSSRFANLLQRIGVRKGDRVATILPRTPEAMSAIIGVFRTGAILVPIFGGFGADAVAYRLAHSGAKAVCVGGRYRDLVPYGRPPCNRYDRRRAVRCESRRYRRPVGYRP